MKYFKEQVLPLVLTVVTFFCLTFLLLFLIHFLNLFTSEKIVLKIHPADVLVGLVVYLKTSIDFAIFIGNLMHTNPGWKKRVAIETGTALGNGLGTFLILIIWSFFREINLLLALMVVVASIVILRLAQDSLEHTKNSANTLPNFINHFTAGFDQILGKFNSLFKFFTTKLMPDKLGSAKSLAFLPLIIFAFTIPFILGLDDFAGYVALFNLVNVFGFAIGVFAGHAILNALLFIAPEKTTRAVKDPFLSFAGSIAFTVIGLWGLFEAVQIVLGR